MRAASSPTPVWRLQQRARGSLRCSGLAEPVGRVCFTPTRRLLCTVHVKPTIARCNTAVCTSHNQYADQGTYFVMLPGLSKRASSYSMCLCLCRNTSSPANKVVNSIYARNMRTQIACCSARSVAILALRYASARLQCESHPHNVPARRMRKCCRDPHIPRPSCPRGAAEPHRSATLLKSQKSNPAPPLPIVAVAMTICFCFCSIWSCHRPPSPPSLPLHAVLYAVRAVLPPLLRHPARLVTDAPGLVGSPASQNPPEAAARRTVRAGTAMQARRRRRRAPAPALEKLPGLGLRIRAARARDLTRKVFARARHEVEKSHALRARAFLRNRPAGVHRAARVRPVRAVALILVGERVALLVYRVCLAPAA